MDVDRLEYGREQQINNINDTKFLVQDENLLTKKKPADMLQNSLSSRFYHMVLKVGRQKFQGRTKWHPTKLGCIFGSS